MGVGHSAACTLAWLAADARPEKVARVALIGGFPAADGELYADLFEPEDGVMPFPSWGPVRGTGLRRPERGGQARHPVRGDPRTRRVTRAVVRLADERRFDVPVVLVCPEFTPAQAREWIAGGDVPELAKARHLDLVDIDSGHWPMFSKSVELARLLAATAED